MQDDAGRGAATRPDEMDDPQDDPMPTPMAISEATRAMSDADLLDALDATESANVHIYPPRSVHADIRTRAAEESPFPVDGHYVRISIGEMITFLWRYFLDTYGPPNGDVARFVYEFRTAYAERRAEAIRRGLVEPTPGEIAAAAEAAARAAEGAR